jgi:hypothetical protein
LLEDCTPPALFGTAAIVRHAYEGRPLEQLSRSFQARIEANPADAAALLDLSIVLEVAGQPEKAKVLRQSAISIRQSYSLANRQRDGLRLLVFKTDGDLMATTPVEFLLEHSNVAAQIFYVDADTPDLRDAPECDVAFMAIAEYEANSGVLSRLGTLLGNWKGSILNRATDCVLALTRTGVAEMFRDHHTVLVPPVVRLERATLSQLSTGQIELSSLLPGHGFPVIVRPVGSHAGQGLRKIDSHDEIASYLPNVTAVSFYVTAFVDYSSADGLYRKQRIAFLDGAAFPVHMAISEHWMVHYLSAGMATDAGRRKEEEKWMSEFHSEFFNRHSAAFKSICGCIGLDYFAIDCAEMPDGRLLLFEADVAMIVHALDAPDVFPYKKPAIQQLFNAFDVALRSRVGSAEKAANE